MEKTFVSVSANLKKHVQFLNSAELYSLIWRVLNTILRPQCNLCSTRIFVVVCLSSMYFPLILGLWNPKTLILQYRKYFLVCFCLDLIIVPTTCASTRWYIVSVQPNTEDLTFNPEHKNFFPLVGGKFLNLRLEYKSSQRAEELANLFFFLTIFNVVCPKREVKVAHLMGFMLSRICIALFLTQLFSI